MIRHIRTGVGRWVQKSIVGRPDYVWARRFSIYQLNLTQRQLRRAIRCELSIIEERLERRLSSPLHIPRKGSGKPTRTATKTMRRSAKS
jgi:hypothetical protein